MNTIKMLLLTGLVTAEHAYRVTNDHLRTLLESTGRFHVTICETVDGITDGFLEKFDLILFNYDGKTWPTDEMKFPDDTTQSSILKFVSGGKGIMFYHSTVWADGYSDEWLKLMGGYASMKDGRRAPADDLIVKTIDGEHPIAAGVKKEWMTVMDDLFTPIHIHPEADVHVIEAVRDDVNYYQSLFEAGVWPPKHHPVNIPDGDLTKMKGVNQDTPVMWTNNYGKGRAFVTTLGHGTGTWERFAFITLLVRGAEWAATGAVTLDAPDRSGDNRLKPWPYY